LQAEGRAHDPYASCDQAAEKTEKQLRRYKRRLKEHHPAGADSRARRA
jgi:ribosome-associated translation inhibitor RaiA